MLMLRRYPAIMWRRYGGPGPRRGHQSGQHAPAGEHHVEHAQHIGGVDAGVVRVVGVALLYSEEEPAAVTGGECDARQTGTDGAALLYAEQEPVHKGAEVKL